MKTALPKLIVHGGAWDIPTKLHERHIIGVKKAIERAYPILLKGGTALDAVQEAVRYLEEDDVFDAGRGSFLNSIGEVELDAIICDGTKMDFGAVASIQNILHPVDVARKVMEDTPHKFMVGKGAQMFAKRIGIEELPVTSLLTEREMKVYHSLKGKLFDEINNPFKANSGASDLYNKVIDLKKPSDTVGAVAIDQYGNLASATSTGGTPLKLPGRVGDAPIFGAGAYADNETAAASCTGHGEAILRVLLCKSACDFTAAKGPHWGTSHAISEMKRRVDGHGGIILIDKGGSYGISYNTPWMARAHVVHRSDRAEDYDIVAEI